MDRSRIAEFVLSCVLPEERAAAVTGDFLEEAESRRPLVLEFDCTDVRRSRGE